MMETLHPGAGHLVGIMSGQQDQYVTIYWNALQDSSQDHERWDHTLAKTA